MNQQVARGKQETGVMQVIRWSADIISGIRQLYILIVGPDHDVMRANKQWDNLL